MNSKMTIIAIVLMTLMTVNCFSLPVKYDTILTKDQTAILEKTTEALGFGFGYDSDIEIDYIFSYSHSKMDLKKKEIEFSQIMNDIDIETIKAFHKRVYRIYSMTMYRLKGYKAKKQWKYHTFIQVELLPPLKSYMDLLQISIYTKEPSYKLTFNEIKNDIDKEVRKYYIKKSEVPNIFEEPIDEIFVYNKISTMNIDKQQEIPDIFEEQVSNMDNFRYVDRKDLLYSDIVDTF